MAELLLTHDHRSVSPAKYRSDFVKFLQTYALKQVVALVCDNFTTRKNLSSTNPGMDNMHHSILIQFSDIIHFDMALAYTLVYHPGDLMPIFNEALWELQQNLILQPTVLNLCRGFNDNESGSSASSNKQKPHVKNNCHIRIVSLPSISDLSKPTIGDIRSQDIHSLIQVTGTIVRTGGVRMLELEKHYECLNPKCKYKFSVKADPEQDNMLPQPRSGKLPPFCTCLFCSAHAVCIS
mmetsp:Transcript_43/g.73  ORF Transcript_43/g.73 Transcript_43/m.73 type:complete len:237 (+) Transcript_43:93-803(+)